MRRVSLGRRGHWMLTAGGLGSMRPFPGTWGSLPPVFLAAVLMLAGFGPAVGGYQSVIYHAVLALVTTAFLGFGLWFARSHGYKPH